MPLRSNSLQNKVRHGIIACWRDKESCLRNAAKATDQQGVIHTRTISPRLCRERERAPVCNLSLTERQASPVWQQQDKARAGHLHGSAATRGCHFAMLGADCRAALQNTCVVANEPLAVH